MDINYLEINNDTFNKTFDFYPKVPRPNHVRIEHRLPIFPIAE